MNVTIQHTKRHYNITSKSKVNMIVQIEVQSALVQCTTKLHQSILELPCLKCCTIVLLLFKLVTSNL